MRAVVVALAVVGCGGKKEPPPPAKLDVTVATPVVDAPPSKPALQWKPADELAAPRRDGRAVMLPDGRVLLVGGFAKMTVSLTPPEILDLTTGRGTSVPRVFVPDDVAGIRLGDAVFTVSPVGVSRFDPATSTWTAGAELFDPKAGTWSQGPALTRARASHALITVGGNLYAIGGQAAMKPLASIEALR